MYNKASAKFILISLMVLIILSCNAIGGQPTSSQSQQGPKSGVYVTAIAVGGIHNCALLNNGTVKCWGTNSAGELGDGTYTSHNMPVTVVGLNNVKAIAAGGEFTCALISSGEVKCWGQNDAGQLGDGTKTKNANPVSVTSLTDIVAISAGDDHACAVTKTGSVKCWGKNLYGRVGNGTFTRLVITPADVVGLDQDVVSISAGNEHTCALTKEGDVKCWGHNEERQLGDGSDKIQVDTPVNVIGLNNKVRSVTTGFAKTCVVTETEEAQCWGWLGLQKFSDSSITISSKVTAIAAGGEHICLITNNGGIKCWGDNKNGQLGIGSTTASNKFVDVKGIQNEAVAIGAAFDNTCALTKFGEVFCWGQNTAGQLGNGTKVNSLEPVQVSGLGE